MKSKHLFVISVLIILFIILLFLLFFGQKPQTISTDFGKEKYQKHCENCHGKNGEGLRDLIPPLTDKNWLMNDGLICIMKYGINDTILVHNKKYIGNMPANPDLENDEIAAIITYMRKEFVEIDAPVSIKEVNQKNCK